jgi:hypothetical protein
LVPIPLEDVIVKARVGSVVSAPQTPPTRMVDVDIPIPIGCHLPLQATPPNVAGF